MIADKTEQNVGQDDIAAKAIATVIIAGILLMFGYTLLHWVIFE